MVSWSICLLSPVIVGGSFWNGKTFGNNLCRDYPGLNVLNDIEIHKSPQYCYTVTEFVTAMLCFERHQITRWLYFKILTPKMLHSSNNLVIRSMCVRSRMLEGLISNCFNSVINSKKPSTNNITSYSQKTSNSVSVCKMRVVNGLGLKLRT